jgi:hypothetical protein
VLRTGDRAELPTSIAFDDKGRFSIASRSRNASDDLAVTRLRADGEVDATFGDGGTWQFDVHGYEDSPVAVRVAPNGDILVGGYTQTGEETHLILARLEGDRDGPPPWQNPRFAADVNDDGQIVPNDALRVINELNTNGPRQLPPYRNLTFHTDYLDVNGDRFFSALDALLIINTVNALLNSASEGESPADAAVIRRAFSAPAIASGADDSVRCPKGNATQDGGTGDGLVGAALTDLASPATSQMNRRMSTWIATTILRSSGSIPSVSNATSDSVVTSFAASNE